MTRKHSITLLAILIPAVLLGALAAVVSIVRAPATFAATGTFTLSQVQDKACSGTYDGITSGAQVRVTGPNGVVVAVGVLDKAQASIDTATTPFGGQQVLIGDTICVFPFSVPNVPAGKVSYGVTIANRATIQASETELRRGIKLQ